MITAWFVKKFEGPASEVLFVLKDILHRIKNIEEEKQEALYEIFLIIMTKWQLNPGNGKQIHLIQEEIESFDRIRKQFKTLEKFIENKIQSMERFMERKHWEKFSDYRYCENNNEILTLEETGDIIDSFKHFLNSKLYLIKKDRCRD